MNNQQYRKMLIERSYRFSLDVIKFVSTFPRYDLALQIIAKQLLRSAMSIGANIVEAQACSSRKDFINYLHHALKSANETKYWLHLLYGSGKIDKQKTQVLRNEATELANLLGSSLLSLKNKK